MTYYSKLYCRAYNWYNTTGKKSKDTLRVSALALLSALPATNILSIILAVSVSIRHTFISKWQSALIYICFIIFNFFYISAEKSDQICNDYNSLDDVEKKQINKTFYAYLIVTTVIFVAIIVYTIYFKAKNGNYDLP